MKYYFRKDKKCCWKIVVSVLSSYDWALMIGFIQALTGLSSLASDYTHKTYAKKDNGSWFEVDLR